MSESERKNTEASPAHRAEQRLAIRFSLPAQVNVQYVRSCRKMHEEDLAKRFWVATKDISRSGIGFYHTKMMYVGEKLRLELRLEGGGFRYVTAMVARCRRTEDGRFEIGAAFEGVESAAESSVAQMAIDELET